MPAMTLKLKKNDRKQFAIARIEDDDDGLGAGRRRRDLRGGYGHHSAWSGCRARALTWVIFRAETPSVSAGCSSSGSSLHGTMLVAPLQVHFTQGPGRLLCHLRLRRSGRGGVGRATT